MSQSRAANTDEILLKYFIGITICVAIIVALTIGWFIMVMSSVPSLERAKGLLQESEKMRERLDLMEIRVRDAEYQIVRLQVPGPQIKKGNEP